METPTPQSYVPEDAYLYFPPKFSQKHTEAQRAVFDGNTEFNPDEIEMITKLKAHALKHNYTFKPIWTDGMILRFLYANNFKMTRTLSSIQDHTVWRETRLPVQIDENLQKFLNSGLLYVHGRDSQFRPIVIFNVSMVDPKKTDIDLVIKAMTFWLEYVIQEWMLPGQIENWVFIANLKGVGAATLALPSMRRLFSYLSDNFKCRLQTLYFLNVAASMYVPWQIIKKFLDDVTVQKIQFYKTQVPTTLFDSVNKEQVEEKYGGTAPNATQFWPPVIPSNNYFVSPKNSQALISQEEYTSMYKKGSLVNMRLNQSLIIERSPVRNSTSTADNMCKSARYTADRAKTAVYGSTEEATDSPNDAFNIESYRSHPGAVSKFTSDSTEIDDMDTDYIDYMDESPEANKERSTVKMFEASFISRLRQHWHTTKSVTY